jgi:hypothetical protein
LNNTYIIKEKNIKHVLDQVDLFQDKMENFKKKYKHFDYDVKINKDNNEWIVELNINNDEKRKTQTS